MTRIALTLPVAVVLSAACGQQALAAFSFAPVSPVATGADSRPVAVALADLDADGDGDLAVALYGTHEVRVWLGDGNGSSWRARMAGSVICTDWGTAASP